MIAGSVGDTISELADRMSSLRDVSNNSAPSITTNIKLHLSTITRFVAAILEQYEDGDEVTREWVRQVTDVVTDLLDLLEDHHLPAATPQTIASLFSSLCSNILTPQSPLLQLKKIEKRLQLLVARAKDATRYATDQGTEIVGRGEEMEEIVQEILEAAQSEGAISVVRIVGAEGIGKTQLAKVVCADARVKGDFDLVVWIDCIRDERFTADSIVKRMIESATMKKKKPEDKGAFVVADENLSLGEAMAGIRFLLVLDDLGDENHGEWLALKGALKGCSSCGAQLITTQSRIADGFEESYALYLDELNEDDSWFLFQKIAGGGEDSIKPEVRDTMKEIVEMCRGVPRTIVRTARRLSRRSLERITESEVYQLKDEIRQEMDYKNLFSWRLKQCFAYSTLVFSTGHIDDFGSVDAATLIRLWMAEGFLGPVDSNSSQQPQPEDLGLECIRELQRKSILINVVENEYGSLASCSMSNDAKRGSAFVARDDNLCMNDPDEDVKESVRRVSLASNLDVSVAIPESLFRNNKKLRAFIFPATLANGHSHSRVPYEEKLTWSACHEIFSTFKRMRVLILQDLGLNVLPTSIGELKSLRYLDLSHNSMKKLPDSIGELKHLQTLRLSHCHQLRELPDGANHFVSLRHLEIGQCLHLTHMPSRLKKLTWLRTLSHFVASTSRKNGHTRGLWELVDLNNLRGQLEILHLERLRFKESDHESHAYLKAKQHLECLILRWNHEDGYDDQNTGKRFQDHDQFSLKYLEPHPNLKGLSIVGYRGNEFPGWLASLKNLVKFSLYNCSKCRKLPLLDELPNLEILRLERLDSLEFIIDDHENEQAVGVDTNKPLFTSLKELIISDCPNLTSWWMGRTQSNARFLSISTLQVKYCPKLVCMPLYPNLDFELVLECSSLKPLLETLTSSMSSSDSDPGSSLPLSKLRRMTIANVEEQSPLPEDWPTNFTSLRRLFIRECKGLILKSLKEGFKLLAPLWSLHIENCVQVDLPNTDDWEGLKNLRSLEIVEMPVLMSLREGIKHLASLRELVIESCPELTALPEGIKDLKSLTLLRIEECHKLTSLPEGLSTLELSTLSITNCPKLLPRCQRETGDDWPHIKHIPIIEVKDTSEYYYK